jgi:hypothetical protein
MDAKKFGCILAYERVVVARQFQFTQAQQI